MVKPLKLAVVWVLHLPFLEGRVILTAQRFVQTVLVQVLQVTSLTCREVCDSRDDARFNQRVRDNAFTLLRDVRVAYLHRCESQQINF